MTPLIFGHCAASLLKLIDRRDHLGFKVIVPRNRANFDCLNGWDLPSDSLNNGKAFLPEPDDGSVFAETSRGEN